MGQEWVVVLVRETALVMGSQAIFPRRGLFWAGGQVPFFTVCKYFLRLMMRVIFLDQFKIYSFVHYQAFLG